MTESPNKELVTGPCSSIESRGSEEEVTVSQLREMHPDGTQIVELNRRHKGPIGFYIARGGALSSNMESLFHDFRKRQTLMNVLLDYLTWAMRC